jgi:hypothetical protein
MLALICFKPVAALVYATALTLTGEGDDPRTVVVGLTMMVLAILVLPALMKLFSWASGSAGHQGSFAGAAATGMGLAAAGVQVGGGIANRRGAARGSSQSSGAAQQQSQHIAQDLGPAVSAGSGGATGAKAAAVAAPPTSAAIGAVYAAGAAVKAASGAAQAAASVMTDDGSPGGATGTDGPTGAKASSSSGGRSTQGNYSRRGGDGSR